MGLQQELPIQQKNSCFEILDTSEISRLQENGSDISILENNGNKILISNVFYQINLDCIFGIRIMSF